MHHTDDSIFNAALAEYGHGTKSPNPVQLGANISHTGIVAPLLTLLTFLIGGLAVAQTIPSPDAIDPATELRRQEDRDRVIRDKQEPRVDIRPDVSERIAPSRLPTDEAPCFPTHKIELRGEDAQRFEWILNHLSDVTHDDSPIDKCLGAQGINVILKRAQDAVIIKGFVTSRVLAEPQDLQSGTLALTIIPGRINAIRFVPDTGTRARLWNALPSQPGDILNLRDIEQGLENFLRIPTAAAHIDIEPTEGPDAKPSFSDLVIDYKQEFPFRLSLFADDSGTKGTGKYQGGVTLSYDNWWTLNDLFYVTASHDLGGGDEGPRRTRGSATHYSLPFGYWTIGTTVSNSSYYQTVAGATQDFTYRGTSDNAEIKLARLVYRDAQRKTTVAVRAFQRKSNNYIDDTEVEVQRRIVGGWEASVSHREFVGAATFDANLAYKRGTGAFESLPAPEEAFGEGTSRFALITADLNVNLPFKLKDQSFRYSGVLRIQTNRTRLTPQDRFAIGGRYSVRGFDGESSLSAERGWLLRNDLGIAVGQTGQEVYLGIDHGEVAGPSSDLLVGKRLTGAVLGLRGGFRKFQYDLFVGTPIQKPEFFRTTGSTAGFSFSLSF